MCVNCNNNACGGCQPVIPQGLPGVNGKNAYTFTTTSFTMPAALGNVTITVQSTGQFSNQWAVPGQIVYIDGAGYFTVVSKTGNNQITINNLDYSGNASPGVTITSNVSVSPAGIKGDTGTTGSAGANGVANLYSNSVTTVNGSTSTLFSLDLFTIAANELSNFSATSADALLVTIGLIHNRNTWNSIPAAQDYVTFNYFGKNITQYLIGYGSINVTFRLTKASATTLNVNYSATGPAIFSFPTGFNNPLVGGPVSINRIETAIDFTTTNIFAIYGYQTIASSITLQGFYIDKIVA